MGKSIPNSSIYFELTIFPFYCSWNPPKIANLIELLKSCVNIWIFENISILKDQKNLPGVIKWHFLGPTYEFLYLLESSHQADFEYDKYCGVRSNKTCTMASFPDKMDIYILYHRFNASEDNIKGPYVY